MKLAQIGFWSEIKFEIMKKTQVRKQIMNNQWCCKGKIT